MASALHKGKQRPGEGQRATASCLLVPRFQSQDMGCDSGIPQRENSLKNKSVARRASSTFHLHNLYENCLCVAGLNTVRIHLLGLPSQGTTE